MDSPTSGDSIDKTGGDLRLSLAFVTSAVFHVVLLSLSGWQSDSFLISASKPSSVISARIERNPRQELENNMPPPVRVHDIKRSEGVPLAGTSSTSSIERSPPRLKGELDSALMNVEVSGSVIVLVAIDRHGVARSVSVRHSTVSREVEAQVVIKLFRANYEPARVDGVAVGGSLVVEISLGPLVTNDN